MSVKIHTVEEIKKMSPADRKELLIQTDKQLAHEKMHIRTKEGKQSHLITSHKKQVARINTINRQENA